MIKATLDTRALHNALAEFANTANADMEDVMRKQAGILVGHVIGITPPGNADNENRSGTITAEARKRGEASVSADIAKLFPTTRIKNDAIVQNMADQGYEWRVGKGERMIITQVALSIGAVRRLHQQSRSKQTGRARKSKGGNMALSRKPIVNDYIKEAKRRVGLLNAGWLRAAQELRTSKGATPPWITRHGTGPGGVTTRTMFGVVEISVTNNNDWFPDRAKMERRLQLAIDRRTNGILKAVDAMIERKARRAEAKINRG